MNRPRFSVVIPTRPRHQTLGYAIQSVLFQEHQDFELIVMDNCSSQETWDVVKQFRFSTGTAWYFRSKGQARRDAYHADEGKDETQLIHPALIPPVNLEVNLADTQLRTRELLFPNDDRFQVRIPTVLAAMAANINRDPARYEAVVQEIRERAEKYSIDPATVGLPPRASETRPTAQGLLSGPNQSIEGLGYCPEAGVHDVAQAARLAASVLPVLTIQ